MRKEEVLVGRSSRAAEREGKRSGASKDAKLRGEKKQEVSGEKNKTQEIIMGGS